MLLDEIEKAHPDVFNILLQILDDGRITDSKGNIINFKNTIIIMTSNIGSNYLLDGNNESSRELVMSELRARFKPEFINRVDEIIMFNSLDEDVILKIIDKFINELDKRLERQDISVELTSEAKKVIIENGYDFQYGARPIKRFIQQHIETLIAKAIVRDEIKAKDHIVVDAIGSQFIINVSKAN